jgi:type I restriction enzyme M protein
MNTTTHTLVQKLWNYCSVLRDDGMSYGDYVEQLTYLLFLKMADERSQPPYNQTSIVPAAYAWPTLLVPAHGLVLCPRRQGERAVF